MKLEVGMYVRGKYYGYRGKIGKIKEELEVIKREIKQGKIKLLEILTKEQFEQMSYKVGE